MPGQEPTVGPLELRQAGPLVEHARARQAGGADPEGGTHLGAVRCTPLLRQRRHETRREACHVGRGHARAGLDLVSGVERGNGREGPPRREQVGLPEPSAAAAERADEVARHGRRAILLERDVDPRQCRAYGDGEVGRPGQTHR